MPIVKCKKCEKSFYAKPHWIKRGWGKYCSVRCLWKSQLKGQFVRCYICKKKIWRAPRQIKHSKSGKYFCGKSCQTFWRNSIVYVGENHPNWKGGESVLYRKTLKRSNRRKVCLLCKIKDKRILAVHHLDHNKKNSKLENLVWLCRNCHFLVHHDIESKNRLTEVVV